MFKQFSLALLGASLGFGLGGVSVADDGRSGAIEKAASAPVLHPPLRRPGALTRAIKDQWVCPMHSEVHSHAPGKCPICNMNLVKVKAKT